MHQIVCPDHDMKLAGAIIGSAELAAHQAVLFDQTLVLPMVEIGVEIAAKGEVILARLEDAPDMMLVHRPLLL